MRILITGAKGQLGSDVVSEATARGHMVLAPSHGELDITDGTATEEYFRINKPEAVIHCAAWTDVDGAEEHEAECRKVNVDGTYLLTEECRKLDIPIIYISTDYVFNGEGTNEWKVDSPVAPLNVYGKSKLDGETVVRSYHRHFIVRISWVFGMNGKNFIKTMLNLSKKTNVVRVVSDQFGSPTYTYDLAPLLCDMIVSEKFGTYHAHNTGICSWYDVAVETFLFAGKTMTVESIKSDEYPMKAKRPFNSRMDTSSLTEAGFAQLPDWTDAVQRYVSRLEI